MFNEEPLSLHVRQCLWGILHQICIGKRVFDVFPFFGFQFSNNQKSSFYLHLIFIPDIHLLEVKQTFQAPFCRITDLDLLPFFTVKPLNVFRHFGSFFHYCQPFGLWTTISFSFRKNQFRFLQVYCLVAVNIKHIRQSQ